VSDQGHSQGFIPKQGLFRESIEMEHEGSEAPDCRHDKVKGKYLIDAFVLGSPKKNKIK